MTKIEALYLNLLRGFIIVLATLALLATIIIGLSAVPSLIERMSDPKADTSSLTLSKFISEQRPVAASEETTDFDIPVEPIIRQAASNVRSYLASRTKASQKELEQALVKSESQIPVGARIDYDQSLLSLSQELKASRGKPLSETRVMALLAWHESRFAANWEQEAMRKSEADAAFHFKILAAGAAFMFFILLAFIFLFVRMERNTRLVHVARDADYA